MRAAVTSAWAWVCAAGTLYVPLTVGGERLSGLSREGSAPLAAQEPCTPATLLLEGLSMTQAAS